MRRVRANLLGGRIIGRSARWILALVWCGAGHLPTALASESGPTTARLAVVLYPGAHDGSPGAILADQGIRQTFARSGWRIDVHNEFLDLSRFASPAQQEDLAEFLRRKYAGRRVDFVVSGLSSATKFALAFRHRIFPGTPLIFMAVDRREIESLNPPADVVGHPTQFELKASLHLALDLHPGTEHVVVVAGRSDFDRYWEANARESFQAWGEQIEFRYWSGRPLAEMLNEIERLPARTLVYYLHVFEDGDGQIHMPAAVLEQLAARSSAPIYSHVDSYIGRGIVGGRVFSFYTAGREAAELGLRLLAGDDPTRIGIQATSRTGTMFDWRQLQRWGVSSARLPTGSELRFREPTVWDQYKWHLMGLLGVCGVQSLLIGGLVVQRNRRARAEARFRQAIDAAPTGMLMVSEQGEIVLVNVRLAQMFAYSPAELVGRAVELLLPARCRQHHHDYRHAYFEQAKRRGMGVGRELSGRRKDGSEFPVEVGLSPICTEAGKFVLASVIDISERRMAETRLRENREELRRLAAQLLGAQEAERRHVARELHDDLGQDLALLAVELDLFQQRFTARSEEAVERLGTMSKRVKRLSSSVHDLSHRLHPMKLEQIGLEAAIRSLCDDLRRSHAMEVTFASTSLPGNLSTEAAICLFRVAQESLRNVVKHSGALHVQVDMTAQATTVRLVVADDGRGFDTGENVRRGGLGLVSMQERLRLVGGVLIIVSQPDVGTRIEACLPLESTSTEADVPISNAAM
ncbi:MAG: PAS domain S-box protein [Pirellulaceae bacterium]